MHRNTPYLFLMLTSVLFCFPQDIQAQVPPAEPSTTVVVEKASPLSISGALEICKGSETILKAEGDFESFTWDKGGTTGRYLKVKEAGTYEVTAKTKGGCSFTTTVTVRL